MDVEKCDSNKVEDNPTQRGKLQQIEDQSINVKWKPTHKVNFFHHSKCLDIIPLILVFAMGRTIVQSNCHRGTVLCYCVQWGHGFS